MCASRTQMDGPLCSKCSSQRGFVCATSGRQVKASPAGIVFKGCGQAAAIVGRMQDEKSCRQWMGQRRGKPNVPRASTAVITSICAMGPIIAVAGTFPKISQARCRQAFGGFAMSGIFHSPGSINLAQSICPITRVCRGSRVCRPPRHYGARYCRQWSCENRTAA